MTSHSFFVLQDPALSNVHSKLQGEGEVIAQNRSRLDDATAASPNVQSNNNSGRSMNSKLLFMPSASCQPPTLPPLPDSPATGLACSSSAFSYSSSVVPPKPDSSGAAIGIPIPPPQPRNSTQASATTLPPLRSVPAKGSNNSKTSGPQYRKVFVPTTVVHNGVARQMLVPMICMVAPMRRASGVPVNAAGLDTANRGGGKSLPTLASKWTSASGNEPALLTRRKVGHRQQAPDKGGTPLSTHHASGAHKKKSHAHHHTRSSTRVAKRAPAISPKAEDQCSDTAALTMLADAALMDL